MKARNLRAFFIFLKKNFARCIANFCIFFKSFNYLREILCYGAFFMVCANFGIEIVSLRNIDGGF